MRWLKSWPLTLRGTGAVALAVTAFVLAHEFNVTELLYVAVLLLAVTAASVATLYLIRRTEKITRAFHPDVATTGEDVDVRARVEIRSALPMTQGLWEDRIDAGLSGDATGVLPAIGSGMGSDRVVELRYRMRAVRRGVRMVGPLSVSATDPFGFARRRHTIGEPTPLTVAPAIVDLGPLTELPGEAGGSLHSETNELGQGSDNLIPRAYMSGDSMRRIHWRASAHRDELMVRQEEQESTPEAIVVFDRSRRRFAPVAAQTPGEDPAFETAVSAFVSAVSRLVHEGYLVTVIDADGTEFAPAIDSGDTIEVEGLAVAAATIVSRGDTAAEDLLRLFAGTITGPLVLVTGSLDDRDAAVLPALAHHSTLPIMLAVGAADAQIARQHEGGWHAASVPAGADLAAAWDAALDRRFSRVR